MGDEVEDGEGTGRVVVVAVPVVSSVVLRQGVIVLRQLLALYLIVRLPGDPAKTRSR